MRRLLIATTCVLLALGLIAVPVAAQRGAPGGVGPGSGPVEPAPPVDQPDPGSDVPQTPPDIAEQSQERAQERLQENEGQCGPDCEPVQGRDQDRVQDRLQDCEGECEPAQDRTQTQSQTQDRSGEGQAATVLAEVVSELVEETPAEGVIVAVQGLLAQTRMGPPEETPGRGPADAAQFGLETAEQARARALELLGTLEADDDQAPPILAMQRVQARLQAHLGSVIERLEGFAWALRLRARLLAMMGGDAQ